MSTTSANIDPTTVYTACSLVAPKSAGTAKLVIKTDITVTGCLKGDSATAGYFLNTVD